MNLAIAATMSKISSILTTVCASSSNVITEGAVKRPNLFVGTILIIV